MITDMRSRLHWRRIRFLDVACRHDWLQGVSRRREATIRKNPASSNKADFMTKFIDRKKIQDIVQNMGYHCTKGRSQYALKAALDDLSRVDQDRQRTENTRTDVRHENTVQTAQIQRSSES